MERSVDAAAVEAHLRRLDADTCAAFVAELWAARGFDTTHEGSVVVASRGDESVVLYPVGDTVFGSAPPPDRPVDIVVAPDGGYRASRAAARDGARIVDATDLREILLYAVERHTAATLCERHLGAPLQDLRPPLRARTRRRFQNGSPSGSWQSGVAVVLTAVALVLAATVLVTGGAGNSGGGTDGTGSGPSDLVALPSSAVTGTASPESARAGTETSEFPPGVTADGIRNLTALSVAHQQPLGTYTTWVEFYRPRGGEPNAIRVKRDATIAVAGDRSLLETNVENLRSGTRTQLFELYDDGDERYIADKRETTVQYRRLSAAELSTDISESGVGFGQYRRETTWEKPLLIPEPDVLRRELVVRYLSTPETDVTGRVTRKGRELYRVVGEGQPAAADSVHNYTFEALITETGLVQRLTAEYTVQTADGNYSAQFEVTYGRLGGTFFRAPPWYEREFGDKRANSSDS